MKLAESLTSPPEVAAVEKQARRLAWIALAYVVSTIVVLGLTMGTSQAMKTVWFDDVLGLIPPLSFLIGTHVAQRPATQEHPYGMHRAPMIGHLASALALIGFGVMLVIESVSTLVEGTRATIGGVTLFGHTIWAGWLMLAAITYSTIPMAILGRLKAKLAKPLHDKALYADADMSKADWMSGVAAACGVVGIGCGIWWADAVAALFVSLDIAHDGTMHIKSAVSGLLGSRPRTIERQRIDPIIERVLTAIRNLDWVSDAVIRLREEGHVVFGEAYVVPLDASDLLNKRDEVVAVARRADSRMHDLVVSFERRLAPEWHDR